MQETICGRSKRRWGDNNKNDLTEIRWCGLAWINVDWGRGGGGGGGGYCTRGITLWGFMNISSFLTN